MAGPGESAAAAGAAVARDMGIRAGDPTDSKALRDVTIQKDEDQSAKGPLSDLEDNKFETMDLRYPLDVGINPDKLHHIKFSINVQNRSQYEYSEKLVGADAESTINRNRAGDMGKGLGTLASADGIAASMGAPGRLVADGIGAAVLGKAFGEAGGELGLALGGLEGGFFGAILGGLVGGTTGTVLVENLSLKRKTTRLKSTICLYIPQGSLNTDMSHTYTDVSMTDALGAVGALGQGASAVGTSITSALQNFFGSSPTNLTSAGVGSFAEAFAGLAKGSGIFGQGIDKTVMFSAGLAVNPQIEFMYASTSHRTFQFAFKFIPRNQDEAKAVREIIKQFRFHSSPELLRGSTGRFFIPPAEFDIQFYFGDQENMAIPKISTCALTNVQVQQSEAAFSTFDDGMPVETIMTLSFQELELMHKQRIKDGY